MQVTVMEILVGLEGFTLAEPQEKIQCLWGGVRGDRHCGQIKLAGVREKYVPKGTEVLNLRQVSIVSKEELEEIAQRMDIPEVTGADLGANIVLSGVPELTKLPTGTIIKFPEQTLLFVTGENLPCVFPGKNIQARYPDIPKLVNKFPKTAMGRRGLVAVVLRPGSIRKNDVVKIDIKTAV